MYRIRILPTAERQLHRAPLLLQRRLAARIDALAADPRGTGVTRLRGQAGYRLRVGSWRALFVIDDQRRELTVTAIGPRKNIYRR